MEYGLIGEKLGHSYSKIIHELIGIYKYDLKEIPKDELKDYILSKDYKGLNVTIPYKQDVIPLLDSIDAGAEAIGAVNCIVNREGKLYGYNTDYYGLKKLIESSGHDLQNKKVLILGTGGTSKTAMKVVEDLGAKEIVKVGRQKREGNISYEEALELHLDADAIVNTTPSGMYPNIDVKPLSLKSFAKLEVLIDVIYNPPRTKLMLEAEELGIDAYGGLKMLVYQAIAAAELFCDCKIEEEKSLKIYRQVRNENENIVLIGMPAVGKSTLGRMLAKELSMELIDTDTEIVKKEGRQISDIFANEGEKYFRDVESEIVKECSLKKGVIIATGGGAILREENVSVLKSFGKLILLNRPLESLIPTGNRPLASDRDKITKLYNERMPIYNKIADVIVDGGNGVEAEVSAVKRFLDEN